MPNLKVSSKTIYAENPAKAKEIAQANGIDVNSVDYLPYVLPKGNEPSTYPGDALEDQEIRADRIRAKLALAEGYLSITLVPGEETIGDIQMCIQYEGAKDTGKGEPDLCVHWQNDLSIRASDWIREVLDELMSDESEWDVEISAHPSPKATIPLHIEKQEQVITGDLSLSDALSQNQNSSIKHMPQYSQQIKP